RLIGCGNDETQPLEDGTGTLNLNRIATRKLAGPVPQRIFQSHADMSSRRRRLGSDWHLVTACAQHRPDVLVAKQSVGCAFHVRHIIGMCAYASENAEHRLHK